MRKPVRGRVWGEGSAAGDRRDDLILFDLRIERGGIQHVLAVYLLGDDAPLLTSLSDDPLRLGDLLAGLWSVSIEIPLDHLVATAVCDDDAMHGEPPWVRFLSS